jgi:RNA polymerase subunit RPABC4/transcription elongation factor Spt4
MISFSLSVNRDELTVEVEEEEVVPRVEKIVFAEEWSGVFISLSVNRLTWDELTVEVEQEVVPRVEKMVFAEEWSGVFISAIPCLMQWSSSSPSEDEEEHARFRIMCIIL